MDRRIWKGPDLRVGKLTIVDIQAGQREHVRAREHGFRHSQQLCVSRSIRIRIITPKWSCHENKSNNKRKHQKEVNSMEETLPLTSSPNTSLFHIVAGEELGVVPDIARPKSLHKTWIIFTKETGTYQWDIRPSRDVVSTTNYPRLKIIRREGRFRTGSYS